MTPRPFCLMVDSASPDEPEPRYYGSLVAAQAGLDALDERWRRFAWITEQQTDGSTVVHVRDGVTA